jgi:hypothetical protein
MCLLKLGAPTNEVLREAEGERQRVLSELDMELNDCAVRYAHSPTMTSYIILHCSSFVLLFVEVKRLTSLCS